MTDNYYKALGLPNNQEIKEIARTEYPMPGDLETGKCRHHYQVGAIDIRNLAASRMKEVATEFADYVKFEWVDTDRGFRRYGHDSETTEVYTMDQLFDLFIRERSGE